MSKLVLFSIKLFLLPSWTDAGRALVVALLLLLAGPTLVSAAASDTAYPALATGQQPPNCVELVVNGDFENVGPGWVPRAGTHLFTYANTPVKHGRQSLQLGFPSAYNSQASMGVEQRLALPTSSESIELSFHYYTEYHGETRAGDQAILAIYDSSSGQPVTTQVLSAATGSRTAGVWQMERHDLTALAGREIQLTFVVDSDGEPGELILYLDDVSILACSSAAGSPATPQVAPNSTPRSVVPDSLPSIAQGVTVRSLPECSCASARYTCSDFSSWSLAQACYTYCQVTAGFDIHGLDQDRNGIACELELQDISLQTATLPTELPILESSESLTVITPTLVTSASLEAETPATLTDTSIEPEATTPVTTGAVLTAAQPGEGAIVHTLPSPTLEVASVSVPAAPAAAPFLSMSSPLVLLGVGIGLGAGVLVVGGLIGFWIAHLAGQRRQSAK